MIPYCIAIERINAATNRPEITAETRLLLRPARPINNHRRRPTGKLLSHLRLPHTEVLPLLPRPMVSQLHHLTPPPPRLRRRTVALVPVILEIQLRRPVRTALIRMAVIPAHPATNPEAVETATEASRRTMETAA